MSSPLLRPALIHRRALGLIDARGERVLVLVLALALGLIPQHRVDGVSDRMLVDPASLASEEAVGGAKTIATSTPRRMKLLPVISASAGAYWAVPIGGTSQ